ncbi:GntR family phosphonate transport system transcriptional regulator [Ensifer sp. SEMIA 135]|uniref:phosphonate metabolism transcriptional regulator PhnF n=1 Tax=Rhizobium meliloti TaxID=382 RepID=UPI000FDBCF30|nr:phosphonate metabolism transcriptional regulator PhnF [Sinorhizobium meliloti]RVL21107.1 phosphonate metabolism transcriptional regulator PhnF [Sinorhizobium meliloti]RVP94617.1 phosphonate metabolism transcriptional regulator PhnF [Sinorhizobium meliloti]TWA88497.1 GntR family phosphonate transport system transcriptional regulator [Ensifer sp. SEMIA 134]TWB24031.1 GntR family phosphonate transport system transcriptional regulator [Ensifer sp. SEMIA 135]
MGTTEPPSLSSRRGGRFLWQAVMDALMKEIRTGVLRAGQRIPTEKELAERFEVNPNTVRRAVSTMQEMGIIRGERGSGMYVKDDVIRYPVGSHTRQGEEFSRLRREGSREFLGARTVRASAEIAAGLKVEPGSYVRKIDLLTWADTKPFSLGILYYPLPRFHQIDLKINEYGSITKALQCFGVQEYRRLESIIRPKILTAREASLLRQNRTKPSLIMTSVNVAADGTPIQFSYGIEAAWVELVVRFPYEKEEAAAAASWRYTDSEE